MTPPDPTEHPKAKAFAESLRKGENGWIPLWYDQHRDKPIGKVTGVEETSGGLLIHAEIADDMWLAVTQPSPYRAMLPPPKPLTRRQRIRHALRGYQLRYRIARRIYPEGFLDDDD